MFLLFANYIAVALGFLGTLITLYGKIYSPSWKTNGLLNLSRAFALPKSPLTGSWVCYETLTAAHLSVWVFYAMVSLTGVPWKNQPIMSYSWLGFISQTKIWMFNVSVSDSYTPVCHSSIEGLHPKERTYLTLLLLKGTIIWQPSGAVWITLRAPLLWVPMCLGILVSNLTKSSNLIGKNSYCILTTGHHKFVLTKYTRRLKKLYNSTLPPLGPTSFTSSLNIPNYLFLGDTSQAQPKNTHGILCLEEGYIFVRRS
jgi:hypothetical protein